MPDNRVENPPQQSKPGEKKVATLSFENGVYEGEAENGNPQGKGQFVL